MWITVVPMENILDMYQRTDSDLYEGGWSDAE